MRYKIRRNFLYIEIDNKYYSIYSNSLKTVLNCEKIVKIVFNGNKHTCGIFTTYDRLPMIVDSNAEYIEITKTEFIKRIIK